MLTVIKISWALASNWLTNCRLMWIYFFIYEIGWFLSKNLDILTIWFSPICMEAGGGGGTQTEPAQGSPRFAMYLFLPLHLLSPPFLFFTIILSLSFSFFLGYDLGMLVPWMGMASPAGSRAGDDSLKLCLCMFVYFLVDDVHPVILRWELNPSINPLGSVWVFQK